MKIEFDPLKNLQNIAKHGLSLGDVVDCDWQTALYVIDDRLDYGEVRYSAMVLLHGRLHNAVFTYRGDVMRVISLRKANKREEASYAQKKYH